MSNRIILPVEAALDRDAMVSQIGGLLGRIGGVVVVVHAVAHNGAPALRAVAEAEGLQLVEAVAAAVRAQGVVARGRLVVGHPAAAILEVARREGATLIVMASHRREGLSRLVFGSVAEAVLRRSALPLLVMPLLDPGNDNEADCCRCEHVLIPIDADDSFRDLAAPLAALSKRLATRATVLRVLAPDADVQSVTAAESQLRAAADALREHGIEVGTALGRGTPAEEVVHYVKHHDCDMVAMTTHGREGLKRLVFGSVAEEVLRQLNLPIFVLRSGSPAARAIDGPAVATAWVRGPEQI